MGARGGGFNKSTRPITLIDAMDHVDNPLHADVVLNSPFTIIRTLNQNQFKKRNQFKDEELIQLLNPIKKYKSSSDFRPNIVIFILESMGREYWGSMNRENKIAEYISYTPFLDSLSKHSLVFSNSFATSRKSIHGMPSILAGIPSFEVSYASSGYSKQNVESIVSVANDLIIQKTCDWINNNLNSPDLLRTSIQLSALTERTYKRRFKKATGLSPIEYIQNIRIEYAKKQLENTKKNIQTISEEINYTDGSYFRRLFKRKTGMTAQTYRKRFSTLNPAKNYLKK